MKATGCEKPPSAFARTETFALPPLITEAEVGVSVSEKLADGLTCSVTPI